MQFTFKRDEEGREGMYVGGVCVARMRRFPDFVVTEAILDTSMLHPLTTIGEAIERADEAGFWKSSAELAQEMRQKDRRWSNALMTFRGKWATNEVAVDIPIADNAVLSVTVGGDES